MATEVTITLDDDVAARLGDLDVWAASVTAQADLDATNVQIRLAREEADAVYEAARTRIVDDGADFATAIDAAKALPLIDRTVKVKPVEDITPRPVEPVEDLIEP